MARKTKHSDYFGNRFDSFGSTMRKFHKKNNRAVMALGLAFGFSAFAGLGYLVFSGTTPEQMETTQPTTPIEQEFVRQPEVPTSKMTAMAGQERFKKVFKSSPKKITKNKRPQSQKMAKIKKTQKTNLICIDPAKLKTVKKARVASAKRR